MGQARKAAKVGKVSLFRPEKDDYGAFADLFKDLM